MTDNQYINDPSYIREMRRHADGKFQIYDVLLAARGYGWEYMLDWADSLIELDLERISQVLSFSNATEDIDVTESFHEHGERCLKTPELEEENGALSVGGFSKVLGLPMKVCWYNQTNVLRFITFTEDETLMKKYVETMIRRSFNTEDAMKLALDPPPLRK